MRRTTATLLGAALAGPVAAGFVAACGDGRAQVAGGTSSAETAPNVVLIVVDTLRRDHLGCYGHARETSPNVDRLAADGVLYRNAWSQAPWTTPSIGSLLSSQYPTTLGIRGDRSALSEDLVLLPEVLAEHGYTTAAFVSHSFCSSEWGFDQGFAHFDESSIAGHTGISSRRVSRLALRFLDEHAAQGGGRPFFLWLHYFDPHNMYRIHRGFAFPQAEGYAGRVTPTSSIYELRADFDALDAADLTELERYYDSEVAFTDHYLGRVLDRLRELGLYDDALIVFTADHGEEFGDHGTLGHAHSLYQELVAVPLIVKYPRGPRRAIEEPVALLDVFPTVLDCAGIATSLPLEGRSLYPPTDALDAGRVVFSETSRKRVLRGAIGAGHKLVHDLETGSWELYDLAADAGERANLAPASPPALHALRGELEAWMEAVSESARVAPELELDGETIEELRALGYSGD